VEQYTYSTNANPGEVLYHPTTSNIYLSSMGYSGSNTRSLLTKINKADGSFVYSFNIGTPLTALVPSINYLRIAFCPVKTYLYMTYATTTYAMIYQVNEATQAYIQGMQVGA
jgi:DNA-binding beta-propeller fold protein YncE